MSVTVRERDLCQPKKSLVPFRRWHFSKDGSLPLEPILHTPMSILETHVHANTVGDTPMSILATRLCQYRRQERRLCQLSASLHVCWVSQVKFRIFHVLTRSNYTGVIWNAFPWDVCFSGRNLNVGGHEIFHVLTRSKYTHPYIKKSIVHTWRMDMYLGHAYRPTYWHA